MITSIPKESNTYISKTLQNKRSSNLSIQQRVNFIFKLLIIVYFLKIFLCNTFFVLSGSFETIFMVMGMFIALCGLCVAWKKLDYRIKLLWILMMLFVLISYFTHFTAGTHICNLIVFMSVLTLLPFVNLKTSTINTIFAIYFLYVIIVAIFAPKLGAENGVVNLNTNRSGTIVFCFMSCAIAKYSHVKNNKKLPLYLILISGFIVLYMFGGRSSLLAAGLLVVYYIGRRIFNKISSKMVGVSVVVLCIFSVLFAFLYSTVLLQALGTDVTILGKNLYTGRQTIWAEVFEILKDKWFLGMGSRLDLGDGVFVSTHNVMLGLMLDFGCIAVVFYVGLLASTISKINNTLIDKTLVAFLLVMLIKTIFEFDFISDWTLSHLCISMTIMYLYSRKKPVVHVYRTNRRRSK